MHKQELVHLLASIASERFTPYEVVLQLSQEKADFIARELPVDYNKLARTGLLGKAPEPSGLGKIKMLITTDGVGNIHAADDPADQHGPGIRQHAKHKQAPKQINRMEMIQFHAKDVNSAS